MGARRLEIGEHAALPHGDALVARMAISRHRPGATAPLVVIADVASVHAVQHGFDVVAVASTYSNPFVV